MKGTLTRVFAVYPLAIPFVMGLLAMAFPAFVAFDETTGRVTLTFTVAELGAAVAGGYAVIAGIFAKWGIKR